MKKSLSWLKAQAKKYDKLTPEKKTCFINEAYNNYSMSWEAIAKLVGSYSQKIRRDAIKLGISSCSKSEAQKRALETGRHPHPTKDKERSDDVKIKISETMYSTWESMDDDERERRRQQAIDIWNEKTPEEQAEFRRAAGDAVRVAAKHGSALEKYLSKELIKAGYKVEFHKEHFILKEKQQIDIFIPKLNTAIEVDGPSHFSNIWGDEVLQKNIERDRIKTGLLLDRGLCIIRIRQTKSLSAKYKRDLLQAVLAELKKIKQSFPPKGERHKILGEINAI